MRHGFVIGKKENRRFGDSREEVERKSGMKILWAEWLWCGRTFGGWEEHLGGVGVRESGVALMRGYR